MEEKIKKLLDKLKEVEALLSKPDVFADQKLFKELSQEHSRLNLLKDTWNYYLKTFQQITENKSLLLSESDPELIEVIKEDIINLERELEITRSKLELILIPPDPRDNRNIIMEIRATIRSASITPATPYFLEINLFNFISPSIIHIICL